MKQENQAPTQEVKQEVTDTYKVHNLLDNQKYYPFNVLEHNGMFIPIIGQTKATNKKFNTLLGAKIYILKKPYDLVLSIVGETYKMLNQQNLQK